MSYMSQAQRYLRSVEDDLALLAGKLRRATAKLSPEQTARVLANVETLHRLREDVGAIRRDL